MKLKIILLLLFFTVFAKAQEQVVSGYVYDQKEDLPLEGATVYLDGTTLAANTDAKGFFTLKAANKINASLIVSFIGFEKAIVEQPFDYGKPIKILLKEGALKLDEVVINATTLFTREQMLKAFREQFLGTSAAGKSCTIENEDDIKLYYDSTDKTLKAEAVKPLRITNKKLQYKVVFDLVDFMVVYNMKTLDKAYLKYSFFAGTSFYTDTSAKGSADKIRKKKYLGSPVHFMKTMAANSWQKEKFQLYVDRWPDNPNKYFKISDSLTFKKITLVDVPANIKNMKFSGFEKEPLMNKKTNSVNPTYAKMSRFSVLYDKDKQSVFSLNNGCFYIDENGLFLPLMSVVFGGYFGEFKAGDMLPADYEYTE